MPPRPLWDPFWRPFGDHFGSYAPKSTSKSNLILTTIRIRFFLKFRSQGAAPRPPKNYFLQYLTALLAYSAFARSTLPGTTLAPFWLPVGSHSGSLWSPFSSHIAFPNRFQNLIRFWLSFYSNLAHFGFDFEATWILNASENQFWAASDQAFGPTT